MKSFEPYVREIENLVTLFHKDERSRLAVDGALDGQPSKALRQLVPLEVLREAGVFFTGSELANRTVALISRDLTLGSSVVDPACGAGDLLLACARHLPTYRDLSATLEMWGSKLKGMDLHPQLVRATKARLLLLALARSGRSPLSLPNLDEVFPNIVVGDSLDVRSELAEADCIALNPPYTLMPAPSDCTWATGAVSQAAVFVERCALEAKPGTKMIAILPDVLRTGSRYERWRHRLETLASPQSVTLEECFDALTDVHVFVAEMVVGQEGTRGQRWWRATEGSDERVANRIENLFDVRVGPVVPYRDPVDGPKRPYLHARGLPAWQSVTAGAEQRQYLGTIFVPPFVVVRRTSRPEDKHRAVGTIVTGKQPVAVENHLLVLKPKTGLMADCKRLLENLRALETNAWLNERIRCRHLTVSALRALPWWI